MFMTATHPTVERLEEFLNKLGIARADFLRTYNITTQRYNNWRNRGIPHSEMDKIAQKVGMSFNYLKYGQGNMNDAGTVEMSVEDTIGTYELNNGLEFASLQTGTRVTLRRVPVLNKDQINAEITPGSLNKNDVEWAHATNVSEMAFAIKTESILNPSERYGFPDSSIIIIDPVAEIENGKPALIIDINKNIMIRRIEIIGGQTYLASINQQYAPIQLTEVMKIIGPVKSVNVEY